ncbi:hypothetical protein H9654_07985 [Stenotrophomonas sp. Sa5BUN4]|uniref:Uncharacterized protein n=1 Tax=Stenotrophomonas lacuserhaii TaxID=2760084 RepID=A0A8X8K247_9GAMM|nr:hypothetical protein [Stenotrophomonas pennii]MBD7954144.1 hypothetical protein [Stenotrophomonas pennii]
MGRNGALLVERFGLIDLALALVVDGGRLQLLPRRWSVWGVPGRIVAYRGTLDADQSEMRMSRVAGTPLPAVAPV